MPSGTCPRLTVRGKPCRNDRQEGGSDCGSHVAGTSLPSVAVMSPSVTEVLSSRDPFDYENMIDGQGNPIGGNEEVVEVIDVSRERREPATVAANTIPEQETTVVGNGSVDVDDVGDGERIEDIMSGERPVHERLPPRQPDASLWNADGTMVDDDSRGLKRVVRELRALWDMLSGVAPRRVRPDEQTHNETFVEEDTYTE